MYRFLSCQEKVIEVKMKDSRPPKVKSGLQFLQWPGHWKLFILSMIAHYQDLQLRESFTKLFSWNFLSGCRQLSFSKTSFICLTLTCLLCLPRSLSLSTREVEERGPGKLYSGENTKNTGRIVLESIAREGMEKSRTGTRQGLPEEFF